MSKSLLRIVAAAVTLVAVQASAQTLPTSDSGVQSSYFETEANPLLIEVSGGCGANGWRGAWGHCHWTHYHDMTPYGYYGAGPYRFAAGPYWNRECPVGSWRGPWGHCRDTPYHGRLPDGDWKN